MHRIGDTLNTSNKFIIIIIINDLEQEKIEKVGGCLWVWELIFADMALRLEVFNSIIYYIYHPY